MYAERPWRGERMPDAEKELDVIVYGATGYTGRLVAEHLLRTYGANGEVRWGMAGRSAEKLSEIRCLIVAPSNIPPIVGDAHYRPSIEAMARRTKAVITTAGPYQLY